MDEWPPRYPRLATMQTYTDAAESETDPLGGLWPTWRVTTIDRCVLMLQRFKRMLRKHMKEET